VLWLLVGLFLGGWVLFFRLSLLDFTDLVRRIKERRKKGKERVKRKNK